MRPSRQSSIRHASRELAAIVIDYDDLYTVLHELNTSEKYPDEFASEILRELRRYLHDNDHQRVGVARAYGDFGAIDGDDGQYIQRMLHLDGFDPHFVPMTLQENAAELAVCVEATSIMTRRPEVRTLVVVTGSRTYLPLVRHVRSLGARVLVVSVLPPTSDDAPQHAEEDAFLNAMNLLSETSRGQLAADVSPDQISPREVHSVPSLSPRREYRRLTNPLARRTVEITEEYFGQYKEVYLTPLLRKLSEVLGEEYDPKSLVSELEEAGAVRLEKRDGQPYDYTVLIMHADHPDVHEIKEAMKQRSSSPYGSYGGGYDSGYGRDDNGYGADDFGSRGGYERSSSRSTSSDESRSSSYDRSSYDVPANGDGGSHDDEADASPTRDEGAWSSEEA